MKKYLAEMPSYTYAVKAQRLLGSSGIASEIVRRESGCGFDLLFYSSAVLAILDKNAVPYRLTDNGGAS